MKKLMITLLSEGHVEVPNSNIEEWIKFMRTSGIICHGGAITEGGMVFYIEF